ncbi:MAG: SGNH/GDSL hydrolase family protein [Candidatus Omnitrophica bacterium]|nr:SGNH/GDSL hydrolase family protein [Candidatus Omnitrophota bacterium]
MLQNKHISLSASLLLFVYIIQVQAGPSSLTPGAEPDSDQVVQVLLLGDSTVQGSVTRAVEPEADQLEDVVRKLLDAEGDLPPVRVINEGRGGEYVRGLLDNRYETVLKDNPKADVITIRYGLNDYGKREGFHDNFKGDLVELIERLRRDYPDAKIYLETVIVYFDETKSGEINERVLQAAEETGVPVIDMYARTEAEREAGNTCLTYHRVPIERIPEKYHSLLPDPWREGEICVLDNRLDAHLKDVPGWFGDKHPNLAGYHVIGDELAIQLAPAIRERYSEN